MLALAALISLTGCDSYFEQRARSEQAVAQKRLDETKAAAEAQEALVNAQLEALRIECVANIASLMKNANILLKAGKPDEATEVLRKCEIVMPNSEASALFKRANDAWTKKNEREAVAAVRAETAAKKKQGVSVGMSPQDALDSKWGRPDRVNRSTNRYGSSEQWVYGDGNYLYFENGVLTSIQN